ncbi:alginate O-acetylation protein [Spirochaetia bacterium]|nr:alginate O-acetylation protein [Spirochaetia bacterium]
MLFSSIPFIILFLPVVLLLYYCCPFLKGKNFILLLASLVFYAWGEQRFVLVMVCSIVMNYGIGVLVGNGSFSAARRKGFLTIGIVLNLGVLFSFKYLGFSEQILNSIIKLFHLSEFQIRIHRFVLPLGISFYTFQSLSYLIDVYRTPALVQKNILNLGLFISFFPQLIAGPIVRYHDINEQIKDRKHDINLFSQGVERFIVGLAKKVLIANTMAEMVDGILAVPYGSVPSAYLLLAVVSGGLQIYYDFSGYSDMAIGLGRMFGFRIMENFDYPFIATNSMDFWRRWHISLSSWFRDYLYIPLGGSRKGPARQIVNTLVVFTLVGLWHGASYNFVFFGFAAGLALILERPAIAGIDALCAGRGKAVRFIRTLLSHVYSNGIRVMLFMFFRLDLQGSFSFYASLFNAGRKAPVPLDVLLLTDMRFYIFFVAAIAFSFPWWRKLRMPDNSVATVLRYIALLCLFVLSFGTLTSDSYNPFIYFRF